MYSEISNAVVLVARLFSSGLPQTGGVYCSECHCVFLSCFVETMQQKFSMHSDSLVKRLSYLTTNLKRQVSSVWTF